MSSDARGWRIALLADALVNPANTSDPGRPDVLALLEAQGYGIMQLPPAAEGRLLLAVIADQIAEYAHHDYALVAVGARGEPDHGLHWRRLIALLRHRGVPPPPRYLVRAGTDAEAEGARLTAALAGHPIRQD